MPAIAVLLAANLLVGILLPLVQSDGGLNGLLQLATPKTPSTGVSQLDGILAGARDRIAPLVQPYNALLREPEVPATYFLEGLEPGARIGGWGEWVTTDGTWRTDAQSASNGSLGRHWVSPANGL